MKTIAKKRVLITGAGHGLGYETAKAFAREGALVILTDRDQVRVHEAVFRLTALGYSAAGYVMDVTDAADVRSIRDRIHQEHGSIDILINNAGIVTGGQFLDVPLEKHLATYDVNTTGPVIVTHFFLPDLLAQEEGHLVNICSASAVIPLPNAATYASSKWAVLGFTESMREELRLANHNNVRVTAICPSYISTGMFNGVKPPLLAGMLTPDWLAGRILRAVRKEQATVFAPFIVSLLPLARATWPRPLFVALLKLLGVTTSMDHWRGHSGTTPLPPVTAPAEQPAPKPTSSVRP